MTLSDLEQACGAGALQPWSVFASGRPSAAWLPADTPVASPTTLDAAQEVLRLAGTDRLRVLPVGSGTHVVPPAGMQLDVVLSLHRLDRIVEYEPEDATLVAESGATLAAIAAQTSPHAQRLGPDPWPGNGTLGGAVAANRCCLNRLRHGAWRDAVLGVQVLHADGTRTRAGGKVVKNVTGYDLTKLYVGSRGSLAVLAQVNVRLLPAPESVACVRIDVPATTDATTLETELSALRRHPELDPVSILVVCGPVPGVSASASGTVVLVCFEGRDRVVEAQASACAQATRGQILAADAAALTDTLRRSLEPTPAKDVVLRVSTLPARVAGCAQDAARCGAFAIGEFGVGTVHVRAPAAHAAALAAWAGARAAAGDLVAADIGRQDLRALFGPLVTAPAPALQCAMKLVFDPHGTLPPAPGVVA